jgi:hypothetical protein
MAFQSEMRSYKATPTSLERQNSRHQASSPPGVSQETALRYGHSLNGYAVFPPVRSAEAGDADVLQQTPDPDSVDERLDQVPSELPHEHGAARGSAPAGPATSESRSDRAHGMFEGISGVVDFAKDASELIPDAEKYAGPLKFLGLDAHAGAIASDYDADGKSARPPVARGLDAVSHGMEMAEDFLPKPFKPVMELGAQAFKGEAWVDEHQDTVLDNPLVSKMFAMTGLDYREPPKTEPARKPETVAPAISEDEWSKTYGTLPPTK